MELYKFDAATSKMIHVEIDNPNVTIKDLTDGPYVLKFVDKVCPFYFCGYDHATINFMHANAKPFVSTQSFVSSLFVAALTKGTAVLDTDHTTMHDLLNLMKEINR